MLKRGETEERGGGEEQQGLCFVCLLGNLPKTQDNSKGAYLTALWLEGQLLSGVEGDLERMWWASKRHDARVLFRVEVCVCECV